MTTRMTDRFGRRLPSLPKFIHPDDMPDRYALTGVGTCMSPLIDDGACCVFDKTEEPNPGDIVGLIFTHEARERRNMPGWIKRLVTPAPIIKSYDEVFLVEQITPPRTYAVAASEVLAMHKFIGTATSTGTGQAIFNSAGREAA